MILGMIQTTFSSSKQHFSQLVPRQLFSAETETCQKQRKQHFALKHQYLTIPKIKKIPFNTETYHKFFQISFFCLFSKPSFRYYFFALYFFFIVF